MTYYIPMDKVLYQVDGPSKKSVRRLYPLLDVESMRSMIESHESLGGKVVLWYNSDKFVATHVERLVYLPAYERLLGTPRTQSLMSQQLPSHASPAIPRLLLDSYILRKMSEMNEYDVVIFCIAGKKHQAPGNRTLIHQVNQLGRNTCFCGNYPSIESRTEIIETATSLSLSCAVVRAMTMDTHDNDYEWEREYRVPCIHL